MSQPSKESAVADTLLQAMALQQTGKFQEAGELYLGILKDQPNHPEANNRMGCLAVQMNQPTASLSYFVTALDAAPARSQYWLNYIDALFQSGQSDEAQQVLILAQQQGLQGDEVDALAARIKRIERTNGQHDKKSASTATKQISNQSDIKAKLAKTNRTTKKSAKFKEAAPSQQEINALIALFTAGRLTEAVPHAQAMTERYPQHEFGWKALGAIFKQMGRKTDALLPMKKAASLSPDDAEAHYNLGVTYQELGQMSDAEASYQQSLQIAPNNAKAFSNLGVLLQNLDRLEDAEASYRQALLIDPNNAKAHSNQGVILQKLGRLDDAEASYRRALRIDEGNAETHCNLGNALKDIGRTNEAEASYRRALQINPSYADAHFNLGNLLQDLDRLEEAELSYQLAVSINPNHADAYFNLGNVFTKRMLLPEAKASYRHALEIDPKLADAHFNLGNILLSDNHFAEAEPSYRHVLEINPDHAEANYSLGFALFRLGKLGEAAVYIWRALKIKPNHVEAHCRLAEILYENNMLLEAEECIQNALKIKPDLAHAYVVLGIILKRLGRLDEAASACQHALDLEPNHVLALSNLGNALFDQGDPSKAEESYRHALKFTPTHNETHSNLLFCMSHNATTDAKTLFDEHLRFGERFELPLIKKWPSHKNSRAPDRSLQVGFVSGDFKNHPIANFIEPVLKHLSSYPQLSLHAYATHVNDDSVSKHLRGYFAHWIRSNHLNNEALAEKIRSDGIDVLIDLSGHTADNRLLTFAFKPAPVQASWMGYPGTTGLTSIDYYFADRFFLPEGEFDDQFTEKIVRLPANAPFLPFVGAPPVNDLPALKNGFVTFGSFNRLSKLNLTTISLWSKLLRTIPDSRLLLAGMPQDQKYDALIAQFEQNGISRNRLDMYPRSDMGTYLALHHKVDICLDTVPYNGGTTTLHALWMGIPTLTQAGRTVAGQTGSMILRHVGLESFIANDTNEFTEKGVILASDFDYLSRIRTELRERFEQSAIIHPEVIAAGVERAIRIMWHRWCNDLPPESFEVVAKDVGKGTQ